MKKMLLTFLACSVTSFFWFAKAQLSLTPLYEKLQLSSNGQAQTTFSVSNGSSEPVRFRASFMPFTFEGTSIAVKSAGDLATSDLSPYLRAAPLEFEIPPQGEQTIRVIALVPPSVLKTELRSALVVEPLVDTTTPLDTSDMADGEVTGRIFFTYSFVAQIYMSSSQHTPTLNIERVQYNYGNALQLVFRNTGLVSGIGNTVWQLSNGQEIVSSSDEAARYIVLPGGNRVGTLIEDLKLRPGEYTLTGTFGTEDGGEPPVVLNPQPFTKTFTVK